MQLAVTSSAGAPGSWGARLETWLERRARPELYGFGRTWPGYKSCIYLGVITGGVFALALGFGLGLSPLTVAALLVGGVAAALGLGHLTRLVSGFESFTFFHYQAMVLLLAAAALAGLGLPLGAHLDVLGLTLGVVQAVGRIGCLKAGCCHGRPASWGVRYGAEHAMTGFPVHLVGVRLLPVQAFESAWLLAVVTAGTVVAASGAPAGWALAIYLVASGTGRFLLELLRGDAERPFWGGFSEAQWTALGLVAAVAAAGWAGLLPVGRWPSWVLAGLVAVLSVLVVLRRRARGRNHQLLHPYHVAELARLLLRLDRPGGEDDVQVAQTSRGLRLSGGVVESGEGPRRHYCLSVAGRPLGTTAAAAVARLILRLRHDGAASTLLPGSPGVFHLLIEPARPSAGG